MIQVLNRALDILEFVAKEPEKPKALGDIIAEMGLNAATCANIVKTLVNRKYLDKIDRSKGYCLGPKAYSLSSNNNYKKHLVEAAKTELEALTKKLDENSLMAILNEDKRIAIARASGTQAIQANTPSEKNAYDAASGRLLIAMLSDDEVEKFISKYGLPDANAWKAASDKKGLLAEIKKIRRDNYAIQITEKQMVGIAIPVRHGNKAVAGISVYMPLQRFNKNMKDELIALLKKTATNIEKKYAADE